jgi:hypothetical protein
MTCDNHSWDARQCPLCGHANECQLCTGAGWKGPCWCAAVEIPDTLLAQVPPELRNRACVCRACIESFRLKETKKANAASGDDSAGAGKSRSGPMDSTT